MGSWWAGQLSAHSLTGTGGWVYAAFSCPRWHSYLGRRAAPWPLASMGFSNSVITSWCFVNVGVARDELWLSSLKYGPSCRAIQQGVKCRSEFGACLLPFSLGHKYSFIHDICHSDNMSAGQRQVLRYWPQRIKEERGQTGGRMKKNSTSVVHREAVRQQLVTVSDKYRGLWSSLLELCLCSLLMGRGRLRRLGAASVLNYPC